MDRKDIGSVGGGGARGSRERRWWRRIARLGLVAMVVGGGVIAASPVAAASGSVGWHGLSSATCLGSSKMLVNLPNVAAAPAPSSAGTFTVGGSFGGGSNPQWIGVRVWLLKWNPTTRAWHYTDQNRDGYYDRTAEFQVQTTSDGILWGANWWNATAGRWIAAGDNTFIVREAGYYILNTEYFWYTNGTVTGYDLLMSKDHFVAEYFYVSKPYCTF